MDTNSKQNTLQINTFTGGMNTDTSDMYLKSDLYRYAENLRVVTDENSNTGELHLIEGTRKASLYTIKDIDGEKTQVNLKGNIMSLKCINDMGIIVIKNYNEDTWSIYTFKLNNNQEQDYEILCTLKAGPFDEKMWRDEDFDYNNNEFINKPISTVVRMEAESVIKLYIADGIHQVLCITVSGEYVGNDFFSFFAYQTVILPPPDISWNKSSDSSIHAVKLQYVYKIFKAQGFDSLWSGMSQVLVGYKNSTSGIPLKKSDTGDDAKYDTIDGTVHGVNVRLPKINIDDDYLVDIYRISYTINGVSPEISLIYEGDYTSSTIVDTGNTVETDVEITVDEFGRNVNSAVIPKEIEAKGDYMFFGNVLYEEDSKNELFKDFDARCFSDGNYYIDKYNVKHEIPYTNLEKLKEIDFSNLRHREFSNDGTDPYRSNNGFDWDKHNWRYFDQESRQYIKGGIGACFKWKYVYETNTIRINHESETFNDKDPDDYSFCRTYRAGDVYRFGVILYDEHGNKSSVKWIADIKMPPHREYTAGGLVDKCVTINSDGKPVESYFSMDKIGIEFTPINTDTDLWKGVKAYQIVLKPRTTDEKLILLQGICGFPLINGDGSELQHPGYLTTNKLVFLLDRKVIGDPGWPNLSYIPGDRDILFYQQSYPKVMLFACPETCFQPDDVKQLIIKDNLRLQKDLLYNALGETDYNQRLFGRADILFNESSDGGVDSYFAGIPARLAIKSPNTSGMVTADEGWDRMKVVPICRYYDSRYGYINERVNILNLTIENCYLFDSSTIDINTRFRQNYDNGAVNFPNWAFNRTWGDYRAVTYPDPYDGFPGEYSGRGYYTMQSFVIPNTVCSEEEYKKNYNDDIKKQININSIEYMSQPSEGLNENYDKLDFVTISRKNESDIDYTNWHAPAHYGILHAKDLQHHDTNLTVLHDWTLKDQDIGNTYAVRRVLCLAAEYVNDGMPNYDNGPALAPLSNAGRWGLAAASKYPIASGGSLLVMSLDEEDDFINVDIDGLPKIDIRNLINPAANGRMYNELSIKNTTYAATPVYSNNFNESVKCFYGDCFFKPFIYYDTHFVPRAGNYIGHTKEVITYIVPIETEIDIRGQFSNKYTPVENNKMDLRTLDIIYHFPEGTYGQESPVYMYNTGYNIMPYVPYYFTEDKYTIRNPYPCRIHWTQAKTDREVIDSWRPIAGDIDNYKDLDSTYGKLTAIKQFKDKLVFWQEKATGILQVNERTIVNDNDSKDIMLSVGEVGLRYDYISTLYGMKENQRSFTNSDTTLYWWDGNKKEIVAHSNNYSSIPLSTINNVKKYLISRNETRLPSLMYDYNNKEVIFNVVDGTDNNKESLVYNEVAKAFTSVYKFSPIWSCDMENKTIVTQDKLDDDLYFYNERSDSDSVLFNNEALPKILFVVNNNPQINKVYDNQSINGNINKDDINFIYKTQLDLIGISNGNDVITDRELDYKLYIPRAIDKETGIPAEYGDRLRGKTLCCEISSDSNDKNFSLLYVLTKYRTSWT